MKLALGDVVLDRTDMALGTVAGHASHDGQNLVAVQVPGHGVRLAEPGDLVVKARCSRPSTPLRTVLTLAVLIVALLMAFIGAHSARDLGADWLLTSLSGLGGYTAVAWLHQGWLHLTGPRRFRI